MSGSKDVENIKVVFNEALDNGDIDTIRKMYKNNKIDLGNVFYEALMRRNTDLMLELIEYYENNIKTEEIGGVGILADMWRTYLGSKYGISVNLDDYGMNDHEVLNEKAHESVAILKSFYKFVLTIHNTLDEYKNYIIDYNKARNKLGELLSKSMHITHGKSPFIYTARIGAPITYENGEVFANAIQKYGLILFNFNNISSERLSYLIKDKTRAETIVNSIVKYFDKNKTGDYHIINSLKYLFNNDIHTNKRDSYFYNILQKHYAYNSEVSKFIEDSIEV